MRNANEILEHLHVSIQPELRGLDCARRLGDSDTNDSDLQYLGFHEDYISAGKLIAAGTMKPKDVSVRISWMVQCHTHTVNLSSSGLEDAHSRDLAALIAESECCYTLILSDNRLGPSAMKDLASALKVNKSISEVGLFLAFGLAQLT